jgi:hypothetical protein
MRLLAAILVAAVAAPAALAVDRPSLRLLVPAPATVVGAGFHPRERIAVTVGTGMEALRRTVLSTATGRFVVRFAKPAPRGSCGVLVVQAVGARGDRAGWKSPPQSCGTQLQP